MEMMSTEFFHRIDTFLKVDNENVQKVLFFHEALMSVKALIALQQADRSHPGSNYSNKLQTAVNELSFTHSERKEVALQMPFVN